MPESRELDLGINVTETTVPKSIKNIDYLGCAGQRSSTHDRLLPHNDIGDCDAGEIINNNN